MKLEILLFRTRAPGGRAEIVPKTTELLDASELRSEVDFALTTLAGDASSGETLATYPAQYVGFAVRHPRVV